MNTILEIDTLIFVKPYYLNGKGKRAYLSQKKFKVPGVYIIKENDIVVYIGMSKSDVWRSLYRHFQEWNDWRRERITYKHLMQQHKYEVSVIRTTPFDASQLETVLIQKYRPRDNTAKLEAIHEEQISPEIVVNKNDEENDLPF